MAASVCSTLVESESSPENVCLVSVCNQHHYYKETQFGALADIFVILVVCVVSAMDAFLGICTVEEALICMMR